jgi:simple sugar transport system ATP-binding protein
MVPRGTEAAEAGGQPILEAREIVKTFGHVHALRGANFQAYAGEVVALIGDNGAGKSTLTKVISGVTAPDSGQLLFEGRPTHITSPAAAQQLGIETVYQDLSLAPDLDGSANIFLGRELYRPGVLGKLGVPAPAPARPGAADRAPARARAPARPEARSRWP